MDKKKLFNNLIDVYGKDLQTDQAIEEMSELTKALIKLRKRPNDTVKLSDVLDEIADVKIMMEQLEFIYDQAGLVPQIIQVKIDRQIQRMAEKQNEFPF